MTIVAPSSPLPAPVAGPRRRSRRSRRRRLLAAGVGAALGAATFLLLPKPPSADSVAPGPAEPAGYTAAVVGVDSLATAAVVITQRPLRALRPDSSVQLAAEVRDTAGRALPGASVAWSSRDSTIALVDPVTGLVRALRQGRTAIVAASGERRDSVLLVVRRRGARTPVVASVVVARPRPLRTGETATLAAAALGANGDTVAGADIAWSSSDTRIATVDRLTGVVQGRSPGTVLMLARSRDDSAVAELTVVPGAVAALQVLGVRPMAVRETLALRVLARDAWGQDAVPDTVTWTSSDATVATVDVSGIVVATGPGSTTITAVSGGIAEGIRLTVVPRPQPVREGTGGAEQARADAGLEAGVDACYGALRSKDVGRVSALYRPTTKVDRELLESPRPDSRDRCGGRGHPSGPRAPDRRRRRDRGFQRATLLDQLVRPAAGERAALPRRVRPGAPRLGNVELPHRGISQALSRRAAHPHSAASSPEFEPSRLGEQSTRPTRPRDAGG